ncbi:MAG TPA: holo-ACP synthase [Holophaga sp.]|nr:holo-ACP synthase [Holophaga sp.]
MILGLGTDICPASRWSHLLDRFNEKPIHRVLHPEEAAYLLAGPHQRLPERMAGRWALREAFGKALGLGLDGWSWKELRFKNGQLTAEGALAQMLVSRKVRAMHGSISHDGGLAFAVVILEGSLD